jgi:hypothetical protein
MPGPGEEHGGESGKPCRTGGGEIDAGFAVIAGEVKDGPETSPCD